MNVAPDSPIGRFRARHAARMEAAAPVYVDLLDDDLVGQIIGPVDVRGARNVLRTITVLADKDDVAEIGVDDLADVVAATTISLHCRIGSKLEALTEDGIPLRFDHRLLANAEIAEPRDIVIATFSAGSPPRLDAVRLMQAATNIAVLLATTEDQRREVAATLVGEPSAATG